MQHKERSSHQKAGPCTALSQTHTTEWEEHRRHTQPPTPVLRNGANGARMRHEDRHYANKRSDTAVVRIQ